MTIPHEQELELYHCNESLCSQKARVGMLEKDVPHKLHHIMLCDLCADCQNLSPEYLRVNPKGIVPTLVHNGEPVYDAHRIIKHVDEHYPDSGVPLWPTGEGQMKAAELWFHEGMLKDDEPLAGSFGNAIPVFTLPLLSYTLQKQPLEVVEKNMSGHPLKMRGQMFMKLRKEGGEVPPEIEELAVESACKGLLLAAGQLNDSGGPWLFGEFSISDITMMACFHRFEDVRLVDVLKENAVAPLAGYWTRLQQRPSYKQGITDWHDQDIWRPALGEIYASAGNPVLDRLKAKLAELA